MRENVPPGPVSSCLLPGTGHLLVRKRLIDWFCSELSGMLAHTGGQAVTIELSFEKARLEFTHT
jgi:hypothetical protein